MIRRDAIDRSVRSARIERVIYVLAMVVIAGLLLWIGASIAATTNGEVNRDSTVWRGVPTFPGPDLPHESHAGPKLPAVVSV